MLIEIDDKSGFCFGVVSAIKAAEQALGRDGVVYSLGDIVHNRVEVQRLEQRGLRVLRHEDLPGVRNATVVIRAHGEPPSVYSQAAANGLELVDATCPVVARLQNIVRQAHVEMQPRGGQVIILGKRGHAEVVGLTGQVNGDAIVIESVADLEPLDFDRPIYLLSQTTQSLTLFEQIREEILTRSRNPFDVTVNDTICRQVANREPHLKEFASRYDVILFVSGRKSSNGRVLFGVCRSANPRTYMVEDESELDPAWFQRAGSVGVCGATSTPKWLMQRVAEAARRMTGG